MSAPYTRAARTEACIIDGCTRIESGSKGLCWPHYMRAREFGSPTAGPPVGFVDKFWARVDRSGGADSCHPWTAASDDFGYGRVGRDGKVLSTHRVAWELTNGAISPGVYILHSCDNPPCCNVVHLREGTAAENTADMHSRGRARTHVLTRAEKQLAVAAISDGETYGRVSRTYGVTVAAIASLVRRAGVRG